MRTNRNFLADEIAEVDQRERQTVQTEEIGVLPLEPHQECLELVDPGKRALGTKAMLVDFWIEQTLPTALAMLAVAQVLRNVGNDSIVETHLPGSFRALPLLW